MVDVHDQLNATQRARVTGLCAIRDHAGPCSMRSWRMGRPSAGSPASHAQRDLRALCVARHGCLSTRANALAFRRDPDYPLLLSLEHYDESRHGQGGYASPGARWTGSSNRAPRASRPKRWRRPSSGAAGSIRLTAPNCLGHPKLRCWRHWPKRGRFSSTRPTGMEDRRRVPVGQRESEAQAGGAIREYHQRNIDALEQVQPEDLPPAVSIEPRLGAGGSGPRRRGVHPAGPGTQDCQVGYSAEAGAWSVKYGEWKRGRT